MKPESGEKGHGKEKGATLGRILKTLLQREAMPRVSGVDALAYGFRVPQMRVPAQLSVVQRATPVCPVPPTDLGDCGDGAPSEPCAPDHLVSGLLLGLLRQAGHFRGTACGPGWRHL